MQIDAQSRPLEIFDAWMTEAKANPAIKEPNAMTLATANASGELSARVVLCKSWSDQGFVFYTNYHSRKAKDLDRQTRAAAVFYWDALARQVNIAGTVKRTDRATSEAYWNSRARESQLSQYISRQSETVDSRETLEKAKREAEAQFAGRPIPCPEHWGGFVLQPERIEFWIGRPGRLHDRHLFEKAPGGWTFRRLYP